MRSQISKGVIKGATDPCNVQIHSLTQTPPQHLEGTVLVAVPLSSQTLLEWMGFSSAKLPESDGSPLKSSPYIIDLRSESAVDPLPSFLSVKCLKEIFSQVEDNKHQLSHRIEVIRQSLTELATQWDQGFQVRPFGWDDVRAPNL